LTTNKERIKIIKNIYYREALISFNELKVKLIPGQRKLIHNEPIIASNFFLDANGNPFPPNTDNSPKNIYELMKCTESNPIIRSMKSALINMVYSNQNKNTFFIESENGEINLNNATFKSIYSEMITRTNTNKEWETKWLNYLESEENHALDWTTIWKKIHSKINNPHVISAQWEILHLNFWSSFKANECCNLCLEITNNNMHIATECKVLIDTIHELKINEYLTSKTILAFGCDNQLVNFVFYHIRKIIFRLRFKNFQNYQSARNHIFYRCRLSITLDLEERFLWATKTNTRTSFENTFLQQNNFELCQITESNKINLIV